MARNCHHLVLAMCDFSAVLHKYYNDGVRTQVLVLPQEVLQRHGEVSSELSSTKLLSVT